MATTRDLQREKSFLRLIQKVAIATKHEMGEKAFLVYTEALCYSAKPEEWESLVSALLENGRLNWFPTIPQFRTFLESHLAERQKVQPYTPAELAAAQERKRRGLEALRAGYTSRPTAPDPALSRGNHE